MGKTVMGYWTCPNCGTKNIEGIKDSCPNCGKAKDKTVKYYLNPESVTEVDNAYNNGIDWYCSYCGAANAEVDTVCIQCGAPKSEQEGSYFDVTGRNKDTIYKNQNDFSDLEVDKDTYEKQEEFENRENILEEQNLESYEEPKKISFFDKVKKHKLPVIGIMMAFFAMLFLVFQIFIPKEQTLTIDGYSWERSISIDELRNVKESGWMLPSGAELEYTKQEIHHYNEVVDHYETKTKTYTEQVLDGYETVSDGYKDNGNGTFTKITKQVPKYRTETKTETYQEPVYKSVPEYRTKYYYNIDKWCYIRSSVSSGTDDDPYWNEPTLSENEKISGRKETYNLETKNKKGKTKTYQIDYNQWDRLRKENPETVRVKVNMVGNVKFMH